MLAHISTRGRIILAALWMISLVAVGVLASAQGRQDGQTVISGSDIGFRPDAVQRKASRVAGVLVVRVNGQWMEAQSTTRVTPVTQ